MSFLTAEESGSSTKVAATTMSTLVNSATLSTKDFAGSGAWTDRSSLQKATFAGTTDHNRVSGSSLMAFDDTKHPNIVGHGH